MALPATSSRICRPIQFGPSPARGRPVKTRPLSPVDAQSICRQVQMLDVIFLLEGAAPLDVLVRGQLEFGDEPRSLRIIRIRPATRTDPAQPCLVRTTRSWSEGTG